MQFIGKKFLTKTLIWLVFEILLNFLGLDNLADYGEFIFERNFLVDRGYHLTIAKSTLA